MSFYVSGKHKTSTLKIRTSPVILLGVSGEQRMKPHRLVGKDNACTGDPVVMVTLNRHVMATRRSELLMSNLHKHESNSLQWHRLYTSPLLNKFELTRLRKWKRKKEERRKQRTGMTGICRNLNNLVGGCEPLCDNWCVFVFSCLFRLYIIDCQCLVSP